MKTKDYTKFKVRCSRYLYTLKVTDAQKADKLRQSLPPGKNDVNRGTRGARCGISAAPTLASHVMRTGCGRSEKAPKIENLSLTTPPPVSLSHASGLTVTDL